MANAAEDNQQRIIAAAVNRLSRLNLKECFDPSDASSRPSEKQWLILNDIGKVQYRWVVAANQCQPGSTLVMTPEGPRRLDCLAVGDTVYSEQGLPIAVTAVWNNGPAEVADITVRGKTWGSCTANHVWAVRTTRNENKEIRADQFSRNYHVRRNSVKAELGPIKEPHAYAIGALLGDGCSKQKGKEIQISSGTPEVPNKVAQILEGNAYRKHISNYTWGLSTDRCNHYEKWCKDRYAHEKIVDLDIVKTWNRESLLEFVAGVIDTDGSIYPARDHISISVSMQAESVLKAIEYAFLALWQVPLNRSVDNRIKYKNGPVYNYYTRNSVYITTIMEELDKYIVSPQKKWRHEYSTLGGGRTRSDSVSAVWGKNRRVEQVYDITVGSDTNLYLLANGLISHNSGKSSVPAREITWILNGDHPHWKRPDNWRNESLLILVAGQDRKMMEIELWGKKLRPFLPAEDWKEVRVGNLLQHVENRNTGDKIVFLSHADSSESNRKHMQGYVAHYVWIDEMPTSINILEELQRRVDSRKGYLIATFTQKSRNESIRRIVESSKAPVGKKYSMSKFDNPLYKGKEEEEFAKLEGYSEAYKRSVLFGDWFTGDSAVYEFNPDTMVKDLPADYSYGWRHCEASDPALQSKFGFTLWAEQPSTGYWYSVKTEYVSGVFVPVDVYNTIMEKTSGYNMIRRISDPHESWYINTASSKGTVYMTPYKKNERKGELIKNLQTALGKTIFITPWCTDLINEVQSCQWSETAENKIINGSSYHLLDASQYFVDCMPKHEPLAAAVDFYTHLRKGNEIRKKKEKAAKLFGTRMKVRRKAW